MPTYSDRGFIQQRGRKLNRTTATPLRCRSFTKEAGWPDRVQSPTFPISRRLVDPTRCPSWLSSRWNAGVLKPRRNSTREFLSAHGQSESERKGAREPAQRSRWLVLSAWHQTHRIRLPAGLRWRRSSGVCGPRNGRMVAELAPRMVFTRDESRGHGATRVQLPPASCTNSGGDPGHDAVACAPSLSFSSRPAPRAAVAVASALWACLPAPNRSMCD